MANPKLIVVRLQGHDGMEDTLPAAHIDHDEHSVLPPPASAAGWHLLTSERIIEDPSPTTELLPSMSNVATTQPPAPGSPSAH